MDLTKGEDSHPIKYWIQDLQLLPEDKASLLEGGWLSDTIWTASSPETVSRCWKFAASYFRWDIDLRCSKKRLCSNITCVWLTLAHNFQYWLSSSTCDSFPNCELYSRIAVPSNKLQLYSLALKGVFSTRVVALIVGYFLWHSQHHYVQGKIHQKFIILNVLSEITSIPSGVTKSPLFHEGLGRECLVFKDKQVLTFTAFADNLSTRRWFLAHHSKNGSTKIVWIHPRRFGWRRILTGFVLHAWRTFLKSYASRDNNYTNLLWVTVKLDWTPD